jgi:hypothetical protein
VLIEWTAICQRGCSAPTGEAQLEVCRRVVNLPYERWECHPRGWSKGNITARPSRDRGVKPARNRSGSKSAEDDLGEISVLFEHLRCISRATIDAARDPSDNPLP